MIVVDTTVLSLAFRRQTPASPVTHLFRWLIEGDAPLVVPGIVLQEILSGIRAPNAFAKMGQIMAGFPLLLATELDHVLAARVANRCRRGGISTTAPDCLIAALTIGHNAQLLTTDRDFAHIAEHSELQLYPLDASRVPSDKPEA